PLEYRTYAGRTHVGVLEGDSPLPAELEEWTQNRLNGAAPEDTCAAARTESASWLDQATFPSWNVPGSQIPSALPVSADVDPRCRELARLPELDEDRRVR